LTVQTLWDRTARRIHSIYRKPYTQKVDVNIGSTTFVTEFENGEQTDYTLIELDNLRKEAQKLIDDIHDGV